MSRPDMIGFQPYETFQLLIETGGIERAAFWLLETFPALGLLG